MNLLPSCKGFRQHPPLIFHTWRKSMNENARFLNTRHYKTTRKKNLKMKIKTSIILARPSINILIQTLTKSLLNLTFTSTFSFWLARDLATRPKTRAFSATRGNMTLSRLEVKAGVTAARIRFHRSPVALFNMSFQSCNGDVVVKWGECFLAGCWGVR